MRVGSLFSGIGGFDLGLERAGMSVAWQSEIDPYAAAILKKHWPHVPNLGDVRSVRGHAVEPVDLICGGFPCQDISESGKRKGLDGHRSGLWFEFARLIGELRPRWIILENVAALRWRGLGRILSDLAALRYDAEWDCVSAAELGCPQSRDRVWLVAYPEGQRRGAVHEEPSLLRKAIEDRSRSACGGRVVHATDPERILRPAIPGMVRVADGFPDRIHRIRGLGNAVTPEFPEAIGRQIMRIERCGSP